MSHHDDSPHDFGSRVTDDLLREILHELRGIRRRLEPRFTAHFKQVTYFHFAGKTYREDATFMAAITAGSQGTFQIQVSASDNSTPVVTNQTVTATDPNVTIAQDTTADPSGSTFNVTVPASDTATTFTLNGTYSASSNTAPQQDNLTITPLDVTISPASVPVTFQAQFVQTK